ncbi:hypothetical protein DPMN_122933 [Dreissena polymorpha]|uniref:Uncharacterized protein n=1 Tax=Dreissena polymorpha TaxID=45954 RepID=A0A9D4GSR8_DREPO|nr:hypothetical protein DPMN_122933 [Dreissena polymorpha]
MNNALHIYDAECDETAEKGSDAYIDIGRLIQFKETFRKTLLSMQFRKHGFCKEAVNEFGLIDKNVCIAGDEGGVVLLFHDAETCFVAKAECQYKPWSFSKTEPNEIVVYMPDFNIIGCEDIKPVRFRFVKKDFK